MARTPQMGEFLPPHTVAASSHAPMETLPLQSTTGAWLNTGGYTSQQCISTTWLWNLHADAHDFRSQTSDLENISRRIFASHFGHLSFVFVWLSGMYFSGARFSNYEAWLADPLHVRPGSQVTWSGWNQDVLNGDLGGGFAAIRVTSGFFNLWRGAGITSEAQLFHTAVLSLCAAWLMVGAGWFHYHRSVPTLSWFNDVNSMLNHHVAGLLGLGSLAWAGHVLHVAYPINKCLDLGGDPQGNTLPHVAILTPELFGDGFNLRNVFGLNWPALEQLTLFGSANPITSGLWLTDIAHHHVAIAVLSLIGGHLYQTQFSIGSRISDLLRAHRLSFTNNLAAMGSLSILFAHHGYAMPAYPYIAFDHAPVLSQFTHHMWIGGFFIVGAGAHGACFMVYDYQLRYSGIIDRILGQKHAVLVHLNWACIFVGLHSFGLYIHNDTMSALGRTNDLIADSALSLQPIFAQWIQHVHLGTFGGALSSPIWNHTAYSAGQEIALMPVPLATSDFLVHHIHAFPIHVACLILLKGVLFARNSRLIPDKALLGFRFPCDGPGRGGTHVFLGLFWMYNSISIVIFHFSWELQSDVWGKLADNGQVTHITDGNFARSANTINGWLRDFLWSQSSQVIQSYGSALGAYGLMFLAGHFVWSFSLMFLFSGRGYWQELIESIVWAHGVLNCAPNIYPRALSIIQGRAVGVAHYLLGGIVTTRAFSLTGRWACRHKKRIGGAESCRGLERTDLGHRFRGGFVDQLVEAAKMVPALDTGYFEELAKWPKWC